MRTQDNSAFDLWLKRGLAQDYGQPLNEALPDELLQLLARSAPER